MKHKNKKYWGIKEKKENFSDATIKSEENGRKGKKENLMKKTKMIADDFLSLVRFIIEVAKRETFLIIYFK